MSQLESVVEELKQLAPAQVQQVAGLVHHLYQSQSSVRQKALAETAGCMSVEEADAFQRTIDEACERIDPEPSGNPD
jgi:hypothetical protein